MTFREVGYSVLDKLVGLIKSRPPSLVSKANNSRSLSLGGALPVSAGMN